MMTGGTPILGNLHDPPCVLFVVINVQYRLLNLLDDRVGKSWALIRKHAGLFRVHSRQYFLGITPVDPFINYSCIP